MQEWIYTKKLVLYSSLSLNKDFLNTEGVKLVTIEDFNRHRQYYKSQVDMGLANPHQTEFPICMAAVSETGLVYSHHLEGIGSDSAIIYVLFYNKSQLEWFLQNFSSSVLATKTGSEIVDCDYRAPEDTAFDWENWEEYRLTSNGQNWDAYNRRGPLYKK